MTHATANPDGSVTLARDDSPGVEYTVKLRADETDPNRGRAWVDVYKNGEPVATPWALHTTDSGPRVAAEFFGVSDAACAVDPATGYITLG